MKHAKRFLVDSVGNYIFFVPLVLLLNAWHWTPAMIAAYLVASIPVGMCGRLYTWFLKHAWYPLCRESF